MYTVWVFRNHEMEFTHEVKDFDTIQIIFEIAQNGAKKDMVDVFYQYEREDEIMCMSNY